MPNAYHVLTLCRYERKANIIHVAEALLQHFLYKSSQSFKLLSSQASNHPSFSWDCSLSQHFCKVLWAASPGVRNWASLLYEYLLGLKPGGPSLEGWVFARCWAAWPKQSEVAVFLQHKLDGLALASNPNSPTQGCFHACWQGAGLSPLHDSKNQSLWSKCHQGQRAPWEKAERTTPYPGIIWLLNEAPIPRKEYLATGHIWKAKEAVWKLNKTDRIQERGKTIWSWGSLSVTTKEAN